MRDQLKKMLGDRVDAYVGMKKTKDEKIARKRESLNKRQAYILKTEANGQIINKVKDQSFDRLQYQWHFKHLIKQGDFFYLEEEVETREAVFYKDKLHEDKEMEADLNDGTGTMEFAGEGGLRAPYIYDRLKAVQYAERWWNDYNPAYRKFDVDCTNYISQCLRAGGAPMRGAPKRNVGWWYQGNNWSFSWAVANALKAYLQHSRTGLRAREVSDPLELQYGDVICYDFQGDGRFDHNTIVTGKDAYGNPLVNAHTYNSRMRYWAYEDSSAYTPNIQYKFYHIIDDQS